MRRVSHRTTLGSTPDLFSPAEMMASRVNSKIDRTSPAIPPAVQLLPRDLSGALKHIDDAGIDRLFSAVIDEARLSPFWA